MPLNNYGATHIHGNYNDIAGSQLNITQVFTSTSTALISRTTANLPSDINSPETMTAMGLQADRRFIMPESQTFREFISVIFDLQATLNPIIEVLGDTEDLRTLSQELSRTLASTALAGRIIEFLEGSTCFRGLVWCRRLTDKVRRSIYTLQKVVEAVVQYRSGVRRRVTGSLKEQLWAVVAHSVSGERNIDGIAREAFYKLVDCTNPLERFLYCAGQSLLHRFKYSFNEAIWQDLSAEIQSHLTIPRFRSPHGMITARGDVYPFDSYTTYSDLCMFLGMYNDIHGWVDTVSEQLLSPKHLSKLIQQGSAPHIIAEPVYTYQVIGDSSPDSKCPRCGSESSYGEWRVCISCGLRFQTTAPNLPDDHWLYLHSLDYVDARYVMAMRLDGSILSSVKCLTAVVPNSATALPILRLLSNVNSPIRVLHLRLFRQPSIHIPDELGTESSPPILQHLTKLTLISFNVVFDSPTVSLPHITEMTLYLISTPDFSVINWLLDFPSVTWLTLNLKWDDPLGSIQQLLLGLPTLVSLAAFELPGITMSTLSQITETVRSIRAQDHPICYINMTLLKNQAELELPNPWAISPWLKVVLDTSRL